MIDCVRDGKEIPAHMKQHTLPNKSRNNWHKEVILNALGRSCAVCSTTNDICIHHKVHYSKGGTNTLDNLVILCQPCHRALHSNT